MSAIEIVVPGGIVNVGGGPIEVLNPEGTSAAGFRITPSQARQGLFLQISAIRDGSGWDNTSTMTFTGSGITVHSTVFIDDMHVTALVTVQFTAPLGFRDVMISTGVDTDTLTNGFEVIRSGGGSYILKRGKPAEFIPSKSASRDKLTETLRALREKADEESLLRLLS